LGGKGKRSLNILVVDDSATVRAVIKKTLEIAEVPVSELHEAADGKQALHILAEDDLVRERALDSLKEMLNVTCGQLLTSFAGEGPVFDLSIPTVAELDGTA
jgi:CheY-like chemotaxis protein